MASTQSRILINTKIHQPKELMQLKIIKKIKQKMKNKLREREREREREK